LARILEGHSLLAQGDSAGAKTVFTDLLETPHSRPDLAWGLFEPLALERLELARIALAEGDPDRSLLLVSPFPSSQPIMFLMYLQEALNIQEEALRVLGRTPSS
jgi:hypothetical protein